VECERPIQPAHRSTPAHPTSRSAPLPLTRPPAPLHSRSPDLPLRSTIFFQVTLPLHSSGFRARSALFSAPALVVTTEATTSVLPPPAESKRDVDVLDELLGAPPTTAASVAVLAQHRNRTSDFFLSKNRNIRHRPLYLNRPNSSKQN